MLPWISSLACGCDMRVRACPCSCQVCAVMQHVPRTTHPTNWPQMISSWAREPRRSTAALHVAQTTCYCRQGVSFARAHQLHSGHASPSLRELSSRSLVLHSRARVPCTLAWAIHSVVVMQLVSWSAYLSTTRPVRPYGTFPHMQQSTRHIWFGSCGACRQVRNRETCRLSRVACGDMPSEERVCHSGCIAGRPRRADAHASRLFYERNHKRRCGGGAGGSAAHRTDAAAV